MEDYKKLKELFTFKFEESNKQTDNKHNNMIIALVDICVEHYEENDKMIAEEKIFKKLEKRGVSYSEMITEIEKRISKENRVIVDFSDTKKYFDYSETHNVGKQWSNQDVEYAVKCYEYLSTKKLRK